MDLKNRLVSVVVLLFLMGTVACKNELNKEEVRADTPTSGEIWIDADASIAPLVLKEAESFGAIYPDAKIHVNVKPEPDAVSDLLNKEVQLIIIPRQLNENELQVIQQNDYSPRQIRIARDAVAFLLNLQNPDSNLRYDQILGILSGKITDWNQVNPSSALGTISVIFDNNRSGLMRYLKDDVLKGTSFTNRAFAADSNSAVLSYIEKNPAAIGVIGASWIVTVEDTFRDIFRKDITVASVSAMDSTDAFFQPLEGPMMKDLYPFMRDIYLISREEGVGLGTGFAKYVITDEGQTIVRLSGLVPAHPPVRVIELKNEF